MNDSHKLSRRRAVRPSPVLRAGAALRAGFKINAHNDRDGLDLLGNLATGDTKLVFADFQYREILDRQQYGNEGVRQVGRAGLRQQSGREIDLMLAEITRVLAPSGHLMRWVDKFTLAEGMTKVEGLMRVDLITFRKNGGPGMGRRSRYVGEYLVIYQKAPVIAKGVWTDHTIEDVLEEPLGWEQEYLPWKTLTGTHRKPVSLQARLIKAVTKPGDLVVDPTAGSYSVLDACRFTGRDFLGCDLK